MFFCYLATAAGLLVVIVTAERVVVMTWQGCCCTVIPGCWPLDYPWSLRSMRLLLHCRRLPVLHIQNKRPSILATTRPQHGRYCVGAA